MFELARAQLLEPTGLDQSDIERAISRLAGGAVDFGELYFQRRVREGWSLEDGSVKSGNWDVDQGVGVRAIAGAGTGFAYADAITLPALLDAADSARAIGRQAGDGRIQLAPAIVTPERYRRSDPTAEGQSADRVELLRTIDAYVRSLDPRVSQVSVNLSASHEAILVAASDGTFAGDVRPLVRLDIRVLMEEGDRREQGFAGGGGRYSLARLQDPEFWQAQAREAVRQAEVNLGATDAPAGHLTVVLGPGWPGVLLHEAIGHGLEGDFNRKGISAFSNRIGEQVASPECTIVDDGTLADRRGSLAIDDEGTPAGCTTLIENGRLVGYMQDKLNARLMGVKPTGNGRRESFAHLPMPRMTNTYMLPGKHDPEEILASVEDGIYAVNFNGGQVDITSGKFVFAASEAYRVKNGKIGPAIKGATLIGNGPDVLTRVGMVGNDLALDSGVGVCGKEGQSVPVGVGQPTLRIDGLTVGGTQ
ncbi:metalloprotease TldD [Wenzhouxiangella marina]|uniref:Protease TldD n=1 Tax=Wenzhouxiangella marina TaxID=1579979 RepID=A0A0K0XTF9_9GAMM|nr:metalloprotease TldD [Wenzhouxiangella marina]AKS40973.1 protease TldD [Wenzhouxiangella marina]MBB6087847.1 TldD protein [Wenzhouxiangella marina]